MRNGSAPTLWGRTGAAAQLSYLRRHAAFAAIDGQPDPTLEAAFDWLEANRPVGEERMVLCWGDARLANLLFDDELTVRGMGARLPDRSFYEVLATAKSCCIGLRLLQLMVAGGFLPPDAELLHNNPATQLLARALDRPAPGGSAQTWAGLR